MVGQSLQAGYHSKTEALILRVSGRSVDMPSLTGLTLEGARKLLESEGLVVGTITEGYSADAQGQTVIAQSVPADSTVMENTVVDITVSSALEKVYQPERWLTIAVPMDNVQVEIVLVTPGETEVSAYSETLSKGTHYVELTSGESGEHQVKIMMDGVLMETVTLTFD